MKELARKNGQSVASAARGAADLNADGKVDAGDAGVAAAWTKRTAVKVGKGAANATRTALRTDLDKDMAVGAAVGAAAGLPVPVVGPVAGAAIGAGGLQLRLRYISQGLEPSQHLQRRADALYDRLGGSDDAGMVYKPKWMRWRTFNRLMDRADYFAGESDVAFAMRAMRLLKMLK